MKRYGDVFYSRKKDSDHVVDILIPEEEDLLPGFGLKDMPLFLYFHGGGLEGGDKADAEVLSSYLIPRGIAVASANYRMYPEAVCPDFFRDAAAAAAFALCSRGEYGITGPVFVGGSSAGANLAMLLCFDGRYLAPYGLKPVDFAGFMLDAGQPTVHYNILRERGMDPRKVVIDEMSAIYHVGEADSYAPLLILFADEDIENRREQNLLLASTMKHFGCDMSRVTVKQLHGTHSSYVGERDEAGDSILGKLIWEFITTS